MISQLPADWRDALAEDLSSEYFADLMAALHVERSRFDVYPAEEDVFSALLFTPLSAVRAVILGQDPYHDRDQAHGLSFSVREGVKLPPSLKNILKELSVDVACPLPAGGCLIPWAQQGVLLLNTVLTVRAHQPNSHSKMGWERFTDAIIRAICCRPERCVFVLWGASAQSKAAGVDAKLHRIIKSPHPSPLSAHTGFFGSRPFTQVNEALTEWHMQTIDWRLNEQRR